MITLVGTGHVFDIGARVREEIRSRAPHAVAIELDKPRYHALRNKDAQTGEAPLVYRALASFQKRLANEYGVEAGAELLAAADEANALGVPLWLIDKDAQATFQRLFSEMRFGEKARLAGSVVASVFMAGKTIEKQVDEMQEDYGAFYVEMGKRFPTVKRVLLDERNEHMAAVLAHMAQAQERIVAAAGRDATEDQDDARRRVRIVAVMGDGHVDGVRDILAGRGLAVETVRLKALRGAAPQGTATATVSFDVPGDGVPPS